MTTIAQGAVAMDAHARPATKAVTYGGNQVAYFDRKIREGLPIVPWGFPVRAEYLSQAQVTRVEFSPFGTAGRPLLEMGQVAS